ncbi:MAG: Ig domain-containing protein [Thermaerobacter sp.]|nr:Ig domain-containing protein [Thermaerobacter sp.]
MAPLKVYLCRTAGLLMVLLAAGACASRTPPAAATPSLVVITKDVSKATVGQPYSRTLEAAGGAPPYRWRLAQGRLPSGISLGTSSGDLTGVPAQAGVFSFTVAVTDRAGKTVFRTLSLRVAAAPASFSPGILAAMRYLEGRTRVPLLAPSGTVAPPGTSPGYYSVWVQSRATSYLVHIGVCPGTGLKEVFRGTARCGPSPSLAVSYNYLDLSAQLFPSVAAARAQVAGLIRGTGGTRVSLGYGVSGTQPTPQSVVWREGTWTFDLDWEVDTGSVDPQAAADVSYLARHPLPRVYGSSYVLDFGDCSIRHNELSWAVGRTVYSLRNEFCGNETLGFKYVSSMRSYP